MTAPPPNEIAPAPPGEDEPLPAIQPVRRRRALIAPRRPVVVVMAIGAIVVVAMVGISVVALTQRDTVELLVPAEAVEGADLRVEISVTGVAPELGEARIRLVPVVLDPERVQGGLVRDDFRILVNASGGEGSHTFDVGQPVRAVEFTVALTGSSVYRYPFDRYDAAVIVLASDGVEPDGDPLVIEQSVASSVLLFDLEAERLEDAQCPFGACVRLEAARPAPTVGYALWFVALVWGLALAGAGVILVIARRGVELPLWAFGFLVGVLFALPPLRASLPGSPPPGGYVDFLAFYWAVAVVGVTLLTLVWLWIREVRHPPG